MALLSAGIGEITGLNDMDLVLEEMIENESADTFGGGFKDGWIDLAAGILDLLWDFVFPDNFGDWLLSALVVAAVVCLIVFTPAKWLLIGGAIIGAGMTVWNAVSLVQEGHSWQYAIGYSFPDLILGMISGGEATAVSKADDVSDAAKLADEAVGVGTAVQNVDDLIELYPDLNIPEGYGDYHTGRTDFQDNISGIKASDEKLAMEEIISDPELGEEIIPELSDPNLPPPPNEWSKMQYVHETESGNITIHYDYNSTTKEYMDFKIVNP